MYTNLLMDLLEECNLFMKAFNTSFQVQPGQSGSIYVLHKAQEQQEASILVLPITFSVSPKVTLLKTDNILLKTKGDVKNIQL